MSLQMASLRAWFWSSCLAGMIPGESRSSSSCSGFGRKNDHDHNSHDNRDIHENHDNHGNHDRETEDGEGYRVIVHSSINVFIVYTWYDVI